MTMYRSNGDRVPDHIVKLAEQTKAGNYDRREFLAMASELKYLLGGLQADLKATGWAQSPRGAIGDDGITPQRFSMLELIGCNPGLQQIQLGNALGLSRSAATLTIDFWEARGCIERCSHKADRRSFGIYPTAKGEAELARLRRLVLEADTALTSALTDEETTEFRRLLAKIHL